MKYEKMLKKELVALLKRRDKTLEGKTRLAARATQPLQQRIDKLTSPVGIADFLRDFVRFLHGNDSARIFQLLATFFEVEPEQTPRILEAVCTWNEIPQEDTVTLSEREAIRKEHFKLNQRIAKQDAQIERLIIERTRARAKAQEIAGLVGIYRRVLSDVLGEPEVVVAPSLAMSPREAVATMAENPGCEASGVFSDEVLKNRNKTAFDEVGE